VLTAWLYGRLVGAQANRPDCAADHGGNDRQGTHDTWRRGSLAHTQGEFTATYGTTLLGATTPPRVDTHFRIASNSKTMTAAVIVLLAQEGKLSLDDPVSKYVPGLPDGDKIAIAELLNMRSGLYTYDDDPEFWAVLERDPTKVWSPAEVLTIAFKHPPTSHPVRTSTVPTPTTRCSV
jgi:CubicO group peptidase (beta-lactamase class C family)